MKIEVVILIFILGTSMPVSATAQPSFGTAPPTTDFDYRLAQQLESYNVQCGVLSEAGLPEGAKPRFTASACRLWVTVSQGDTTRFDFVGSIDGKMITWTFEGDAKLNVFKQLAPQKGGKFNRSVQNGLACFVEFDDEGLDDVESMVCYKRSTLRKITGWDRKSGSKYPLP